MCPWSCSRRQCSSTLTTLPMSSRWPGHGKCKGEGHGERGRVRERAWPGHSKGRGMDVVNLSE